MLTTLAQELEPLLLSQGRLIQLPEHRQTVYVGDTHGDRQATESVLHRWLGNETVLVFLGDTVDRGPDSRGNLTLILQAKKDHPDSVFLLMGNHEAWSVSSFSPADFWTGLNPEEEEVLGDVFSALPFAAWHPAGVLATHAGLPKVKMLAAIPSIALGSPAWRDMVWGDWSDHPPNVSAAWHSIRPTYGESEFRQRMDRLGARVLVRSHQPRAPQYLYKDRCLTVFTSSAYGPGDRTVACLDPISPPETARGLELIRL